MPALGPERWQQVSPYLDEVLDLPESDRAPWLESFRMQNPELADILLQLMAEQRAAEQSHFLEGTALHQAIPSTLAGKQVGAYRLISLIGEGGMGSVWLAERSDGRFQRRVAIKFLRFSVASQGGAERFRREGVILGQLTHPHIAELIDAGLTNGEPYLVLEYVDGDPIDQYCDKHRLNVDARIRLFLDVLSAVAQAHANLIVHRDIKPSNVLVSHEGQVKLLDFGIAKLLAQDENSSPVTVLSQPGGGALTPQYAAPEQVTGGAVSTATDVYALGVLLYLLLTGQHPAGATLHSPAELVKAIVETEPQRVSDVVTATESKIVAEKYGTTAEKLRRELRGDLDTIVSKALKKDLAERYASVTAVADDLQRYLKQEPIRARPDTVAYRAAKFVRRNRLGVALAAVALIAVLAGITGTLVQARNAKRQRDAAIRERDRTNRVTEFMTNMFRVSDPSVARGNTVTVREILDKTSNEIGAGLGTDAGTQAQMMQVMGEIYYHLGLYARADTLLTQALDIRRKVLGDENPETLKTMSYLGKTLSVEGHNDQAEKLVRDALAAQRRILGPDNPDVLSSMDAMAIVVSRQNRLAEAEQLDRETIARRRRVLGEENPDTLASIGNLAWILQVERHYDEAEKLQREALTVEQRTLGADDVDTTVSENMLARILSLEHRYPEAEKLQRQALEVQRRVLGVGHTFTERSLNNLADILYHEGLYAESEALFTEIRNVDQGVPNNPRTAIDTYSMGDLEALQGHSTRALSLLREAVDQGLSADLDLGMDKDDDLKSLRGDRRFEAVVAYARKHALQASTPK